HSAQTGAQSHLGGSVRPTDELRDRIGAQVDVDDLTSGLHTGVGAASDDGGHLGAGDAFEPGFDGGLDGAQPRLLGPDVEIRAPVAEVDAEPVHVGSLAEVGPTSSPATAVKGSRGLMTLVNRRE